MGRSGTRTAGSFLKPSSTSFLRPKRGAATSFLAAYEEWGSYAGPPSRPLPDDVAATSLLLSWEAPEHLGGSGFEVLGCQVLVQYGGAGGFHVLIPDTGSAHPQCIVEGLAPDEWHEFQVKAHTSAGTGAASSSSRPVLTERPPELLRELRTAERTLSSLRDRLTRRKDEILTVARSARCCCSRRSSSRRLRTAARPPLRPAQGKEEDHDALPAPAGGKAGWTSEAGRVRTARELSADVTGPKPKPHPRPHPGMQAECRRDSCGGAPAKAAGEADCGARRARRRGQLKVATLRAKQAGTDAARLEALAEKAASSARTARASQERCARRAVRMAGLR